MALSVVGKLLDNISRGLVTNNTEMVELSAHSIKGSAANFGAKKVQELAYKMEKFGHAADFESADKLLPALENELNILIIALKKYQKENLEKQLVYLN